MVKKVKKKTNKMTYDQFKDIQDKKDLMNRIKEEQSQGRNWGAIIAGIIFTLIIVLKFLDAFN